MVRPVEPGMGSSHMYGSPQMNRMLTSRVMNASRIVALPNHWARRPMSVAPQKAATLQAPVTAVMAMTWNVGSDSMSPSMTRIPPIAAALKATTMMTAIVRRRSRTNRDRSRAAGSGVGVVGSDGVDGDE